MDTTFGTSRRIGALEHVVERLLRVEEAVLDNAAFAAVLSVMLASSAAVIGIIAGSP